MEFLKLSKETHGVFLKLTHKNSKQIDLESIDSENINQVLNKYHENGN